MQRASSSGARDWPALVSGSVAALWRWRLELVLIRGPVLGWRLLARPTGPVLAGVLVAVTLAAVLAPTAVRGALVHWLRAGRVRRRWRRAWLDVGLPRVAARRVWQVPAGELVRIRCSRGSSIPDVAARAEHLAACLVGAVPGRRRRAGRQREHGAARTQPTAGRRARRGQERRALTRARDGRARPVGEAVAVGGKLVELAAWAPCAERIAGGEVDDAIGLLEAVQGEMEARYRDLLARGARKISEGEELPLHMVACDELAFYLTVEDRKQRVRFAELLRDLVARSRAAGIIVVAATQKPAADVVPSSLRDLFGFRLAMRCTTPQASDTILGQGWASDGYSAATIAPTQRGIGFLLAEDGLPLRMRTFYLDDRAVDQLAQRAAALRGAKS